MSHPRLKYRDIKVAATVIRCVATVTFAFSVFGFYVFWAIWNRVAPAGLQFDHSWALLKLMSITTGIDIFLQPFMLISNQLQENSADERHDKIIKRLDNIQGIQ